MHKELLERWGGDEGGGHRGANYEGVEAAVQAVKNSYYNSLEELAAAYAVYIVQGHVFQDGNKRAGLDAMMTFLAINGSQLRTTPKKARNAMVELQTMAESGMQTDRLVLWLVETLFPLPKREKS
jgi:death-on-curing protein